jgi:branched-chain amino acid aminotransferase
MNKVDKIWMNGALIDWDAAQVHVLTHAIHYGSSAFEGVRFYETVKGPAIFRLQEHTARLFQSAKALAMEIPFTAEQLNQATIDLINANAIPAGYIRPIVFYGYGKMGLYPKGASIDTVIAVWPWAKYLAKDAVKVKISSFMRIHPKSTIATAKLGGHYINSIMASLEAHGEGFDEALLLDFEGQIAEGPGENIFYIKDQTLYTPPQGSILCGITRDSVMKICADKGLKVIEKKFGVDELIESDECFFTGTAAEITAIEQIDNHKIKNALGPITQEIKETYLNAVHGKIPEYQTWLTYTKNV